MKLVFVSSTFKDMQFERDMLHTHVIPLLDSRLTRYGESVRFGDLRWGVNTTEYSEEESSKKVLKVCLDQIDDCKPYMIVFIGERYGWIPSQDLIKNAAILKGIDHVEDDISVTQLEIEYGALLNPDYEGRILFYFRELDKEGMTPEERKIYEAESSLHEEKIKILKEKIYNLYPNYVKTYQAKWNKETKKVENLIPLMDQIKEDLEKIFISDIEQYNSLDWQERALLASHEYFKEKAKVYVNTKTIHTKIKQLNQSVSLWMSPNSPCSFEYYVGKEGTGKTTRVAYEYMSHYHNSINKNDGKIRVVIPFIYQIDEYTSVLENLYYIIIYHLEKALGIKHKKYDYKDNKYSNPPEAVIDYLLSLIKKIKNKNIFVQVVIDNIKVNDFFTTFKIMEEKLNNFEKKTFYENLPIFFTFGINEEYLPPNTPFFDISESFPLDKLYKEEIEEIIYNILKFSRKELSKKVINHLLSKEQANDPYYLSLVINRLLMLDSEDFQNIRNLGDGMDAINEYMIMIVDQVGDNVKEIIKEIVKETAQRIDFDYVCKFLSVTVYTNLWLKLSEYEDIFKFANWEYNELNTSLLLNNLKYIFEKRDNNSEYKITNKEVLKGIKEFIIENKYDYVLDILFKYLDKLPKNHELKNYSLHFAMSTHNGNFIAEYYLKNTNIEKIKKDDLETYKIYSDFITKLVKEKEYDVLLDFFKTLCKKNVSVSHYYLLSALTKNKLNKEEYKEFVDFTIDLHTWLVENKQIDNEFKDTIFIWLQLSTCINLAELETMISFERALIIYNYCSFSKNKLPRELLAEVSILLLRTTLRNMNVFDNYEVVKNYFEEMIDFNAESLEKVVFKDYYKYIIKGYIANLINKLAYKVNDDIYKKYLAVYERTLNSGCKNNSFINMNSIVQETYAIGYFHHAYLYVNFDDSDYLKSIINYIYSDNVLPLLNDIDQCIFSVEYYDYKKEDDVENMLFRGYKKTLFLNNYYDGYKKNVFVIISMILERLSTLNSEVLDEISNSLEELFIQIINHYNLEFENGSDEFISSAAMDSLEYFSYIISQLYLFDETESIKRILNNVLVSINNSLEESNPYINMILYTLLYSFTDSTDEEDEVYTDEFVKNYELMDKKSDLYKNYKKLINACLLYITGSVSFEEYNKYLYEIYCLKFDTDRVVNG